jgi:hypothetical protein
VQCNMTHDDASPTATSANDGAGHRAPPLPAWRIWFDAWEPKAAAAWDGALRAPWVVEPVAAALTLAGRANTIRREVARRLWRACGLATQHDQDRVLFLLQRLESRILDLEDRLADRDGAVP